MNRSSPHSETPDWAHAVAVFDLETTGVDVARDRIVTAHVGLLDASGGVVQARDWLVDPGVAIPAAASAVHGITDEIARGRGCRADAAVAEIVAELGEFFAHGVPVVAYNAAFDFSLLTHEATRHGVAPLVEPSPVIDPLVIDKACDPWRRGARTLTAVATHYAVALHAAHEASADAIAAGRIAQALAQKYATVLPADPVELHARQIGWARDQAASLTEYFIRIGRLDPTDNIDGGWPVR